MSSICFSSGMKESIRVWTIPGSSVPSTQSQYSSLIRSLVKEFDPSLHLMTSDAKYFSSVKQRVKFNLKISTVLYEYNTHRRREPRGWIPIGTFEWSEKAKLRLWRKQTMRKNTRFVGSIGAGERFWGVLLALEVSPLDLRVSHGEG